MAINCFRLRRQRQLTSLVDLFPLFPVPRTSTHLVEVNTPESRFSSVEIFVSPVLTFTPFFFRRSTTFLPDPCSDLLCCHHETTPEYSLIIPSDKPARHPLSPGIIPSIHPVLSHYFSMVLRMTLPMIRMRVKAVPLSYVLSISGRVEHSIRRHTGDIVQ